MDGALNIRSFPFWHYQFEIDGESTLDPVKDATRIGRVTNRKRLFFDPLRNFLKGKRVLDLGCNAGYWSLVSLIEGGAAFVRGIDSFPEVIDQANWVFEKQGIERSKYDFVLSDTSHFLEVDTDTYDVVLCLGFYYHINDPVRLMSLMSRHCSGIVVIDTVIHRSEEAMISVRPCALHPSLLSGSVKGLELVSSPKAIAWMGHEAGLTNFRVLATSMDRISSTWDYNSGERGAFALSRDTDLDAIYPGCTDPGFLPPQQDLQLFGYFPEMRGGRDAVARSTKKTVVPLSDGRPS